MKPYFTNDSEIGDVNLKRTLRMSGYASDLYHNMSPVLN